jgi:hypothetical protein
VPAHEHQHEDSAEHEQLGLHFLLFLSTVTNTPLALEYSTEVPGSE